MQPSYRRRRLDSAYLPPCLDCYILSPPLPCPRGHQPPHSCPLRDSRLSQCLTSPHLISPCCHCRYHTLIEKVITAAAPSHVPSTLHASCSLLLVRRLHANNSTAYITHPVLFHHPLLGPSILSLVNLSIQTQCKLHPFLPPSLPSSLPSSNLSHSTPASPQNYIATLHPLMPGDDLAGELVVDPRTGDFVLLETGDARI